MNRTTDDDRLAQRAAHFRRLVLDVTYGPGGMIVAFPRFDTRRPFQEGDEFADGYRHVAEIIDGAWNEYGSRLTVAEFLYGENTLWATGWLLWSQLLRHRVTGEPEAAATARKCFRDLNYLFRLCGALEPGVLGKPHGGRGGVTTSFDQSANPVLFYALFARSWRRRRSAPWPRRTWRPTATTSCGATGSSTCSASSTGSSSQCRRSAS